MGTEHRARTARNVTRDTDLATSLEVASSLWAKFMGLMGRRELPAGAGLWLPASNGIHMMFMRFPIDAVFVGRPVTGDASGAGGGGNRAQTGVEAPGAVEGATAVEAPGELRPVLSVHRNLRAWTGLVPLVRGAHGVLELPVGTIEASGTQVGDVIRLG